MASLPRRLTAAIEHADHVILDAGSGALLNYYGIEETEFYTVFFSVSRAMGLLSQLILSRAMWEPITRPKSHTTDWYKAFAAK